MTTSCFCSSSGTTSCCLTNRRLFSSRTVTSSCQIYLRLVAVELLVPLQEPLQHPGHGGENEQILVLKQNPFPFIRNTNLFCSLQKTKPTHLFRSTHRTTDHRTTRDGTEVSMVCVFSSFSVVVLCCCCCCLDYPQPASQNVSIRLSAVSSSSQVLSSVWTGPLSCLCFLIGPLDGWSPSCLFVSAAASAFWKFCHHSALF